MSDILIVALIMSATTLIPYFLSRRDMRKDREQLTTISNNQDKLHKEMNGMKDQLVKQSGKLGEEKGNKAGRLEEKAEQKSRDDKK